MRVAQKYHIHQFCGGASTIMSSAGVKGAGTNGRPLVFFDVSLGDAPLGRIKMELFSDVVPRCVVRILVA